MQREATTCSPTTVEEWEHVADVDGAGERIVSGLAAWQRFVLGKGDRSIDQSISQIVASAYRTVPAFRARLDAQGISPRWIISKRSLRLLPSISRDEWAAMPRCDLLRRGCRRSRCHVGPTSGTTGTPLLVTMSRTEALYRRILLFRAIRQSARIRLPFSIAEVGTGPAGAARERDLTQRLGLSRTVRILRDLPPEDQAKRLFETRPQVITGHPSCLETVAEAIEQSGRQRWSGTRLVVCRGEMLTPRTRVLLERAFACRVSDFYNCEEIGNIAWECPEQSGVMHITTDGCVVEILDDGDQPVPDGEEGNVVLTNLFNRTMPFVRYRLGDRAALRPPEEQCSCGHRGSSMSLVAGRSDDSIWLPSGRRVSPRVVDSIVGMAMMNESADTGFSTRQYRIVQRTQSEVDVRLASASHPSEELVERIREGFHRLSPDLRCRIEVVTTFDDEPGRKVRAITSHVRSTTEPLPRSA